MGIIQTFLLVSMALTQMATGSATADGEMVVQGNNAFALDLYAELKNRDGNLFFSPHSISTALAMTYAGARGSTERQMAQVLHFELGQEGLHPAFRELFMELNSRQGGRRYELSVANALWGQKGYRFLEEFRELVRKNYGGGLNQVDFVKASETARRTINTWVEGETRGRITDLLKPGIINSWTRLVLTNAIYFKGYWASRFKEELTEEAPFTLVTGGKVNIPMMHLNGEFRYMETDDFQALELPYLGGDLSMVVFLPKETEGIRNFEPSLTAGDLKKWLARLREQEVLVALPKFKMTCDFRLDQTLKSMGMTDAFEEADFSGMTGRKELFIAAVVHKAFVEVNEEGTEAAAATGVVVALKSAPPSQPVFRADHPFLFLIRDLGSNSILFIGRVMDPRE
ncbi:MAG: serpin family protein [Candidatus Zixiibacteriota bacterium]